MHFIGRRFSPHIQTITAIELRKAIQMDIIQSVYLTALY